MRINLKSIPAGLCAGYSVRDGNEEIHFAVLRDGRIRTTRVTAPTNHFFKNRNGTQPSILGWTPGLPSDAEYIGHYPANLCRPLEAREDEAEFCQTYAFESLTRPLMVRHETPDEHRVLSVIIDQNASAYWYAEARRLLGIEE